MWVLCNVLCCCFSATVTNKHELVHAEVTTPMQQPQPQNSLTTETQPQRKVSDSGCWQWNEQCYLLQSWHSNNNKKPLQKETPLASLSTSVFPVMYLCELSQLPYCRATAAHEYNEHKWLLNSLLLSFLVWCLLVQTGFCISEKNK